jgi:4-diphosphocytidyl-2-C-methyl-D-erythritol kinase
VIVERANAKVNLVLRVGPPRDDGMHPLCSLFAALELADEVRAAPRDDGAGDDEIVCPGVAGDNLAASALAAFRATGAGNPLPALRVEIDKRIPVAAGLAGGSADAAAVLRAANALAGTPLSSAELRELAAGLGSDVPSQVEPAHAIVSGIGERVERVDLLPMTLVLVAQDEGLSTAAVYAELDRLGGHAAELDPEPLRALAMAESVGELAAGLVNDLQPAALSLRPDLTKPLDALQGAGAVGAAVTGSGPTTFGLFENHVAAERAAATIDGQRAAVAQAAGTPPPTLAIVTGLLAS